jgi:hypothetical protein
VQDPLQLEFMSCLSDQDFSTGCLYISNKIKFLPKAYFGREFNQKKGLREQTQTLFVFLLWGE